MAGKFSLADHIQAAQPPQVRDIETITVEILDAKRAGGEAILTIGKGLMEAKALLSHGEWLPWLEERVEFSEKAAQRFMKLAREYSNPTALSDLGATKALMLLAIPAENREEFISEPHLVNGEEKTVIDMTSRELEAAIKERDEALKAAAQAQADQSAAEQAREKLTADMQFANERIAGLSAEVEVQSGRAREAQDAAARLEKELEALRSRPVEVAVEADPAAIEAARNEAEAAMRDKLDKARQAQAKAEAAQLTAENNLAAVRLELEQAQTKAWFAQQRAEKKAALASSEDLVLFRTLFDQAQEIVNKMNGVLLKVRPKDPEKAEGLSKALLALADKAYSFMEDAKAQGRSEEPVLNGWMPGGTLPFTDCDVVADFALYDGNEVREVCQFSDGRFCWSVTCEPIDMPVVRWMALPPVDGAPGIVPDPDTGEDGDDG